MENYISANPTEKYIAQNQEGVNELVSSGRFDFGEKVYVIDPGETKIMGNDGKLYDVHTPGSSGGGGDVSGKADKVSNAVSGDLAGLDSSGNLTDTGIAAEDVENALSSLGIIETTYEELYQLVGNGELVPGQKYRITDYETIINGAYMYTDAETGDSYFVNYAHSANHRFDIVVTAINENTLSDKASAMHSASDVDNYFLYSKLDLWELHYTIYNDASIYAWANEQEGKGVIFYMKDEFNNECGYDFKNIQYLVFQIETDEYYDGFDSTSYLNYSTSNIYNASSYWLIKQFDNVCDGGTFDPFPLGFHKQFSVGNDVVGGEGYSYTPEELDINIVSNWYADWYYTFSAIEVDAETGDARALDASLFYGASNNSIENYFGSLPSNYLNEEYPGGSKLPIVIFIIQSGTNLANNKCKNSFGITAESDNNVFDGCSGVIMSVSTNNKLFNLSDTACSRDCNYNQLSGINHILGESCENNIIGMGTDEVWLTYLCSYNTVGTNSSGIIIDGYGEDEQGLGCNGNHIGINCSGIQMNESSYNEIGDCNNEIYVHSSEGNILQNNCKGIEMYTSVYCLFESGAAIICLGDSTGTDAMFNCHILSGNYIDADSGDAQVVFVPTSEYTATWIGLDSNGTIKTWNPADLVQ